MWKSQRSPRVANSSQAAEIFGLFMGIDAATTLKSLTSEILYATPLKEVMIDIRNDNVNTVRAVHQMGNTSTEKRLQSIINAMRLMVCEEAIASVSYIPGGINIADELAKATSGNMLFNLLSRNKIQVPTEEVVFWQIYANAH